MKVKVIFHSFAEKLEEEIDFDHEPTCYEAALALIEKKERSAEEVKGSIYLVGKDRLSPDAVVSDGTVLDIYKVLSEG